MKTINLIMGFLFIIILSGSCVSRKENETKQENEIKTQGVLPLNISIFIDLSDRITKESDGMYQSEKDSVIVEYIAKVFQNVVLKNKIQKSRDRIKVFFYPTPKISRITDVARNLEIDFSKYPIGNDRRVIYKNIITQINDNLSLIYNSTLKSKQWIGSDIWGFFEERARDLCVQKDYRNILIILSDGYIYHSDNKQKKGNNYSYITTNTLNIGDSGLIPCSHSDLNELEVLFLEIDAPIGHRKRMIKIIEDWFRGMNIEKVKIVKTDQPINTAKIIDNFLNK